MQDTKNLIAKKIETKIEDYNGRYFSPTPATIRKWKREAAAELDRKNQLPLPLDFGPEPYQDSLFPSEESTP